MHDRLGDKVRLVHILEAIQEIENYVDGVSMEDFWSNSMRYNATLRQLEIIGEASNRLSESIYQNYPLIPWRRLNGLRNVIIHEYFGIDDKMIWNIIQINLKQLKPEIQDIITKLK